MDLIAEVIPNQWVTGIGAGIISSIVAYLIAQRYLSWGGNKEYLRKVDTANKDVIYALRSIISDEFKFNVTPEMLSSIISANSVKHGVDQKDMYSPDQFIDALVKEVMDSNFLSVNTKMSYCTSIISLKIPLTPELEELSTIAPSIKLSQQSQLIKLSSLLR
ncbi:hypothetical protein [Methanoculleus bourgensis]|jgi:hypothetical protein|uniref:hypothetical protein n=1 Tax=Methanoculleus bourgensis TaxID=83986 RepID=UPI002FDA203E